MGDPAKRHKQQGTARHCTNGTAAWYSTAPHNTQRHGMAQQQTAWHPLDDKNDDNKWQWQQREKQSTHNTTINLDLYPLLWWWASGSTAQMAWHGTNSTTAWCFKAPHGTKTRHNSRTAYQEQQHKRSRNDAWLGLWILGRLVDGWCYKYDGTILVELMLL